MTGGYPTRFLSGLTAFTLHDCSKLLLAVAKTSCQEISLAARPNGVHRLDRVLLQHPLEDVREPDQSSSKTMIGIAVELLQS